MRLTLGMIKQGRTPQALGVCADDPRLVQWLNEAQERLLNRGRWYGTVARVMFCVSDNCVTWPREVATIEAIKLADASVPIRNLWYEFRQFSGPNVPQEWDAAGSSLELVDRGMSPTVSDIRGTNKKVRVYATRAEDEGKRILVQGRDENGQWIRTNDGGTIVDGEWITLSLTGTDSVNYFDGGITGVQKDVTSYDVLMYQWGGTSVERLLGRYQPTEVAPMYRRSYIRNMPYAGSNELTQVEAIVSLQHVPVVTDTDWFIIQNEPALKLGALSVKLEEVGETDRAEIEMRKAIRELQRQLDKMSSDTNVVIATGHGTATPNRLFSGFM